MLFILFISPNFAAGGMLEPEDNVKVQCDYFWEDINILNQPENIEVSLTVYNLTAEVPIRQLILTVASYSENFDNNNIETLYYGSGEKIPAVPLKTDYYSYFGVYFHEFRLTFGKPLDKTNTINITYVTNGSKWDNDKTKKILYVQVWSIGIVNKAMSVVHVQGEGEGFKIKRVIEPPQEKLSFYNERQGFGFLIKPGMLISDSYNRFVWAEYTPAYLSQWYVWDQYQKIMETLQQTNQVLEETKNQLFYTRLALGINIVALILTAFAFWRSRKGVHMDKKKAKVGSSSKTKKTSVKMKSELLIFIAFLILLMGAINFYIGEQSLLENSSFTKTHQFSSLYGQMVVIMASPLLVLAAICFSIEDKPERWNRIARLILHISFFTALFNIIANTPYLSLVILTGSFPASIVIYLSIVFSILIIFLYFVMSKKFGLKNIFVLVLEKLR